MVYDALRAEVAELVDALGSGSSRLTPVLVRVQSSAPLKAKARKHNVCGLFVFYDNNFDNSPQAYYFQQARNGVYVRMALLASILGVV